MEKAKRIRLVRAIGVIIAILFLAVGAGLTETNANELAYGTDGEFSTEETAENLTIIVFTDVNDGNCPGFSFQVIDEEGTAIPVDKMECEKWYSNDVWQYRIGSLEAGEYTYRASDDVSIVAVNGDVTEYLENYALGNGLADAGSCFCCLSFVVPFILGRVSSRTMDAAHEIQFNDSFVMPAPFQEVSEPPVEGPVDQTDENEPAGEEEETPEGAFWGGLGGE